MATDLPPDLAGQHARFNALVLPHLDRLLGFARRRMIDTSDAEDAVQETCVRAWSAFGELRDATSARPWLYQIMRNVLSDTVDKSGRRQQLVPITRLDDTMEELVASDGDVVFAEVAARIDCEALRAALRAIPEDFARAVELHDIDGFKYQEIADIEGIALGTVMSRISRGRRLLAGAIASNRGAWALGASAHDVTVPARPRRTTDRGMA